MGVASHSKGYSSPQDAAPAVVVSGPSVLEPVPPGPPGSLVMLSGLVTPAEIVGFVFPLMAAQQASRTSARSSVFFFILIRQLYNLTARDLLYTQHKLPSKTKKLLHHEKKFSQNSLDREQKK